MISYYKTTAKESSITNSDFYNNFKPIIPNIDRMGKIAQIISAITEAFTIWIIAQSKMTLLPKAVSIIISLLTIFIVVALLELGTRKFLQVVCRTIIWGRLKNLWSVLLFTSTLGIVVALGISSFYLSTNGISQAFLNGVQIDSHFNDNDLNEHLKNTVADIRTAFEEELVLIQQNHNNIQTSTARNFEVLIQKANKKSNHYKAKLRDGYTWAKDQLHKSEQTKTDLEHKKAIALLNTNVAYEKDFKDWQHRKEEAISGEKSAYLARLQKKEFSHQQQYASEREEAELWASIFSGLIGISVILAYACIIMVEIFRRGAGIKIEYVEEQRNRNVISVLWKATNLRINTFFRNIALRIANGESNTASHKSTTIINNNGDFSTNTNKDLSMPKSY